MSNFAEYDADELNDIKLTIAGDDEEGLGWENALFDHTMAVAYLTNVEGDKLEFNQHSCDFGDEGGTWGNILSWIGTTEEENPGYTLQRLMFLP